MIEFVVGEERGLVDLLSAAEVSPLLDEVADAGAACVRVEDDGGRVLWSLERSEAGEPAPEPGDVTFPVFLEGEEVGRIVARGGGEDPEQFARAASVAARALSGMAESSLKRMLTTETHVHVVKETHRELLESFRRLEASERGYRELAETLEVKVRERTAELEAAMTRLAQQETMAAVGRLAAGVAHEINNPLGFVASNITTLGRYAGRFAEYDAAVGAILDKGPVTPEDADALRALRGRLKIASVARDIPDLVRQTLDGTERVRGIVSDLRGFSHVDDGEVQLVDIAAEIERTLRVIAAEIPPGTAVEKDMEPVPPCHCHPARVGVILLHLLRNAFQSRGEGLAVRIRARAEGASAVVEIGDNGPGIPPEIRRRIFEPFFTTREIGTGKGLGLSVAYDAARALEGRIEVACPEGGGAVFRLILPLEGSVHGEVR
ncbi:MAG: ATP-binding protein [Thermodesulfobacteriota bacterium]